MFIGEVVVVMVVEFGVWYVIVGYLECCVYYGESSEMVVVKM